VAAGWISDTARKRQENKKRRQNWRARRKPRPLLLLDGPRFSTNRLEADIVVADLTDHNPNVMFELGLRMAIAKKPVCIIKSKDTGRIFDVDNVLRVHEYSENLWNSTVERDVPDLSEHIKAPWDSRNTGSSYIEILTDRSGSTGYGTRPCTHKSA
jgi:hypothetical protein